MIIHVKRACEFRNKDGEKFYAPKDFIGLCPEWVEHNAYFKALCKDGKITFHIDTARAEVAAADEKIAKENKRKGKTSDAE